MDEQVRRLAVGLSEDAVGVGGCPALVSRATVDKFIEDVGVDGSLITREFVFHPDLDLEREWTETIADMRRGSDLWAANRRPFMPVLRALCSLCAEHGAQSVLEHGPGPPTGLRHGSPGTGDRRTGVCLMTGATLLSKRDVVQRLLGSVQVAIFKAREVLRGTPPMSLNEELRSTAASPSAPPVL